MYVVLIKGPAANPKSYADVQKHLLEMMGNGMHPNVATYNAIFEGFVRELKIKEAHQFLRKMKIKDYPEPKRPGLWRNHLHSLWKQTYRKDQAWKYRVEVEMDEQKGYKYLQCKLCDKILKGWVYRMKEHLASIHGNVVPCTNVTLKDLEGNKQGLDKEARENTCMDIARFFYENGRAFNVASSPSFVNMLRSVGNYGRDLKEPTTHELSTTLLMAEEVNTQSIVDEVRKHMDSNIGVHYVGWVEGYERKTIVKLPRKQSIWHSVLKFKLCKVRSVQFGQKGIPYLNTYDGRTIRYPDPLIKANDTIKLDLETNKITDFIKFDVGNVVMVTGGRNRGRVGIIKNREKQKGSFETVHIQDALGHEFATRLGNVYTIGKGSKPWVSLPKGKGIKLSIIEEARKRQAQATATTA
ncbi:hypothetical protein EZV62_024842 [Acer yangbiense]|uniref:BED-type domain-containing protein n=1 Tax=Acer yangbiense TaxID=1000413 RepID=A0A5C7GWU6_9ROSI|nr:hypothetical protein EZV62_024842 [Acer yangbiense]